MSAPFEPTMKHSPENQALETFSRETICRCGHAPRRPGQRNCLRCHALANQVYRSRIKASREAAQALALRAIAQRVAPVPEDG